MKWTLEKRKLKDLKENAKNPRRLTKEQAAHLQESIEKFGCCEPIVINVDGTIIGGHQRYRIQKKLGYKELYVYIPERELDEKEADELNIRLNKNTGEFDFDLLANHWDSDDLLSWGFSPQELQLEDPKDPIEDKTIMSRMTISFASPEQLQDAENRISVIVDEYPGSKYKVKI